MSIQFIYYCFAAKPNSSGEYYIEDHLSDPVIISPLQLAALEIWENCCTESNGQTSWNKAKTKKFVSENFFKCSTFISDEYGNPGASMDAYDYDSFVGDVMDAMPDEFWQYAFMSDINPTGFTSGGDYGVIGFKIL